MPTETCNEKPTKKIVHWQNEYFGMCVCVVPAFYMVDIENFMFLKVYHFKIGFYELFELKIDAKFFFNNLLSFLQRCGARCHSEK
jgi:hypothetical protein